MTRDHRRKKAVRAYAAETGRTYMDADKSMRTSPPRTAALAARLRDDLAVALETAGWPVVIEHNPQFHALRTYAGPATVDVRREAEPRWSAAGDEHPDDPEAFNLDSPLEVTVWAPLTVQYSEELERVLGVDAHKIPADRPATAIVAEIDRVVGQARQRDLAATPASAECGICGDRYPANGLFQSAPSQVDVCPCCAFDGDLLGALPGMLAFQLDRAASESLVLPAGWSGSQALLCCLGGPGLPGWLLEEWRAAGTVYVPMEWWGDASQTWIWLPPADRRPAALASLGCGASLAHIMSAIDRAHPDLRGLYQARRDEEIAEHLGDEYSGDVRPGDDAGLRVPETLVERFWPAAVAYTVAMLTQHAERASFRNPWHLLESFELPDWVETMAPELDHYHVETVLRGGILTIRDALGPRGPQ